MKLKVLPLGITAEPGFGVVARRAFSTGEYIFELIGLLTLQRKTVAAKTAGGLVLVSWQV